MKSILTICFLIGFSWWVRPQQNLIPNGGFEEYVSNKKPKNWSFSWGFFNRNDEFGYEPARSGQYCPKLYANAGQFYVIDDNHQSAAIDVQGGATYLLTYWYKGTMPRENMQLVVDWYDDTPTRIKREYKEKVLPDAVDWQKKEVELSVPAGINKMGLYFVMTYSSRGGYIMIDDVELVLKSNATGGALSMPTNFQVHTFQREALLSWDKEADTALQWEVVVNGSTPQLTDKNSFLVTGLIPSQTYSFKVRAVKGSEASDYTSVISRATQSMLYGVDDWQRVPHLRTLRDDGSCSQTIDLFFNDLAQNYTSISYFVDGNPIQPNQYQLTFPKKGKQKLKIIIVETADRQWELEYDLEVQ